MEPQGQGGFEELECYQLAQQVLREAYMLARQLPAEEKYNLADQMRRAATSAALNIAEGYGRYHYLERLRFLYIARGSLMETLGGFACCETAGYITPSEMARLRGLAHSSLRSLNGYIRFIRKQRQGRQEYGTRLVREEPPAYSITPEGLDK